MNKLNKNTNVEWHIDSHGHPRATLTINKRKFWYTFRSKETLSDILMFLQTDHGLGKNQYVSLLKRLTSRSFFLNIERDETYIMDSIDDLPKLTTELDSFIAMI